MTIREHFQRTMRRLVWGTAAGLTVIVIIWDRIHPIASPSQFWSRVVMLGIAYSVIGILLLRRSFACPCCGAQLQKLRHRKLGLWNRDRRMFWILWDACPRCDVGFDALYGR